MTNSEDCDFKIIFTYHHDSACDKTYVNKVLLRIMIIIKTYFQRKFIVKILCKKIQHTSLEITRESCDTPLMLLPVSPEVRVYGVQLRDKPFFGIHVNSFKINSLTYIFFPKITLCISKSNININVLFNISVV